MTLKQPGLLISALTLIVALILAPRDARADNVPKPDAQGTVVVGLQTPLKTLVVLLSGDGGWWGDLDAQIAAHLAKNGFAVIGLDTGIWFDHPRTPDEISAHVSNLLNTYRRRTGARSIVLAGYSFGADMVPLIYNRLTFFERARIGELVLVAPGRRASLEVTLAERTGLEDGTLDLASELAKLPAHRVLCVYGQEEADSTGCTLAPMKKAETFVLPGGHHFAGDIARLENVILNHLKGLGHLKGW